MLEWINDKPIRLICPDFADVFIGCEALEGFEPPGEVIGHHEAVEMGLQLFMRVVVIPFYSRFLDGSVHALDLPVRPGMVGLGEAVLDVIGLAAHIEHVRHIPGCRPVTIAQRERKLDTVTYPALIDQALWKACEAIYSRASVPFWPFF